MSLNFSAVAQQFVDFYYKTFDSGNRAALSSLYQPASMLTWAGVASHGTTDIMNALTKPELNAIKHRVTSFDAQPTPRGDILLIVTGTIANLSFAPNLYSDVFLLQSVPGQSGSFFVGNQIFQVIAPPSP